MHNIQHIDALFIKLFSCYLDFGLFVPSMQGEKIKQDEKKVNDNENVRLIKEPKGKNSEIFGLKVELETAKRTCEVQFSQLEEEAKSTIEELTQKTQEYEHQLEELQNKVKVFHFALLSNILLHVLWCYFFNQN